MFSITYGDIKISKNKNEPARPEKNSLSLKGLKVESKIHYRYTIPGIDREQF